MQPVATQRHRTSRARLADVCCGLGPRDRPYPETHRGWCIALVRRGTFSYYGHDAPRGRELRPGWLLLGRDGHEFECRHPRAGGDDCTSLHVSAALVEDVRAQVRLPGGALLPTSVLPPVPRVVGEFARAERALRAGGQLDLDARALAVIEAVLAAAGGDVAPPRAPSRRDRAQVAAALDAIDGAPHEPWALGDLAELVAASPFHFARAFKAIVGVPPHRYVVAARLRRAAMLLLDTRRPVTEVAYEVGFGDLSNFVHTFRRAMGATPSQFRARS
jgi:AraC-like DNA-binding protein|nr:AraC family transcriptional regulator [Kofleriaceae bacterium]